MTRNRTAARPCFANASWPRWWRIAEKVPLPTDNERQDASRAAGFHAHPVGRGDRSDRDARHGIAMKNWNVRALAALVAAAAVVVYATSLWNGFALDDVAIIQQNARVHDLANQAGIWLTPYWPIYGPELGLYRPLAIFAFALQWAVGDGAPWLFHAASIALHAGVSVLVFLLLRTLTTSPVAAAAGALVFAVHPVHVEAVANIVGQAELLAATALLGATLLATTRPAGARVSWPRRASICALFLLGALAKESIVVLPALIVALDTAQGRIRAAGGPLRYARALAVPIFLLAATFAAVMLLRVDVLGALTSDSIAPGLPFLRGEHRVLVAFQAVPEFFRLLLLPADLSSDYTPGVIVPASSITAAVVLGGLLLAGAAAVALLTPTLPAAGVPAAWFLIAILPVSNLFFPIGVVVAERLLYVPSIAIAFVVAYGWRHIAARADVPARAPACALAAIVILCGARTAMRIPDWRDTNAAIAALVRDHPESYRAQNLVGAALLESEPAKAREYLELAYATWPDDPFLLSQIGRLELGGGDIARAVALLERARDLAPFVHETESSLAYGYVTLGRSAAALGALDRAQRLGADPLTLLALRAQAYEGMGRQGPAAGAWRAAAHGDSGNVQHWKLLARSLARGSLDAAALAAVDTARAVGGFADEGILAALERAIRAGCYRAPPVAGTPCADPLAHERMVLPGQLARNTTEKR
jgi:tetratricopeptide (TPR) repeat protein